MLICLLLVFGSLKTINGENKSTHHLRTDCDVCQTSDDSCSPSWSEKPNVDVALKGSDGSEPTLRSVALFWRAKYSKPNQRTSILEVWSPKRHNLLYK